MNQGSLTNLHIHNMNSNEQYISSLYPSKGYQITATSQTILTVQFNDISNPFPYPKHLIIQSTQLKHLVSYMNQRDHIIKQFILIICYCLIIADGHQNSVPLVLVLSWLAILWDIYSVQPISDLPYCLIDDTMRD